MTDSVVFWYHRLLDIVHADQKLYLVFEFLDVDLKRYMEAGNSQGTPLSLELCQVCVFVLFFFFVPLPVVRRIILPRARHKYAMPMLPLSACQCVCAPNSALTGGCYARHLLTPDTDIRNRLIVLAILLFLLRARIHHVTERYDTGANSFPEEGRRAAPRSIPHCSVQEELLCAN
jgi:hypothetical protein